MIPMNCPTRPFGIRPMKRRFASEATERDDREWRERDWELRGRFPIAILVVNRLVEPLDRWAKQRSDDFGWPVAWARPTIAGTQFAWRERRKLEVDSALSRSGLEQQKNVDWP